MTGKVVTLSGAPVLAMHEPVPDIVAKLEELLRRAQAGEIRAMAWVFVTNGGSGNYTTGWSHDRLQNLNLQAGIGALDYRFNKASDDE